LNEYHDFIETLARNETIARDFQNNVQELLKSEPNYFDYSPFRDPSMNFTFNCKIEPSPQPPTSVHQLRAGDIKVVAALGDSLTAALGSNAKTVIGLLVEYRGRSWSIGGDKSLEELVTLPNILKMFNPKVVGFTTGTDISFLTKEGKGLNVAVSGQEANHIPEQAKRLVQRLKESKEINFENDWKLITLFIGGNDLCRYCSNDAKHLPKAYINDIKQGLDILYKEIPKAFVNLVSVLRVEEVKSLNKGLICKTLHKFGCKCAAYPDSSSDERHLVEFTKEYQQGIEDLVNSKAYYGREDFTVVVQPFMKDMAIPKTPKGDVDLTYFAPDCFHLSTKGHTAASIGIWNNLFQPIGRKDTQWVIGEKLSCPPADHPYLFTYKN